MDPTALLASLLCGSCSLEGLRCWVFSSSSLRAERPCLSSRQVVPADTHAILVIKKRSEAQLLQPRGPAGTSPEDPRCFRSAFSDAADALHAAGLRRRGNPESKETATRKTGSRVDVRWISSGGQLAERSGSHGAPRWCESFLIAFLLPLKLL